VRSCACIVDTSALASFSLSASRFRIPPATPAPSRLSSPKPLKPLPDIGIFRQSQLFTLGYKSRVGWLPTTLAYARDPVVRFNHRIHSPQRSAAVPTWREDVQREKIAWFFSLVDSFPEHKINPLPRRAAATICLPARCGVGVPPCAKLRVPTCGFRGWEPSLLYVTKIRTARYYGFMAGTCQNLPGLARSLNQNMHE
jgi:hypothetical protein